MLKLSDYGKMLLGKRCTCQAEPSLAAQPIDHYDHSGGWRVDGFEFRQWLSVECPKCKYQWSLRKLGVTGKASFEEQLWEEIRMYGHVVTFTTTHTAQQLEAQLRAAAR